MSNLEKLIDEAAATGGLTAITLFPQPGGGWACNVKRRNGPNTEGWRCIPHKGPNPSKGLIAALSGPVSDAVVHDMTRGKAAPDEDIFG